MRKKTKRKDGGTCIVCVRVWMRMCEREREQKGGGCGEIVVINQQRKVAERCFSSLCFIDESSDCADNPIAVPRIFGEQKFLARLWITSQLRPCDVLTLLAHWLVTVWSCSVRRR